MDIKGLLRAKFQLCLLRTMSFSIATKLSSLSFGKWWWWGGGEAAVVVEDGAVEVGPSFEVDFGSRMRGFIWVQGIWTPTHYDGFIYLRSHWWDVGYFIETRE